MRLHDVDEIMADAGRDWCLFVPGQPMMVPWQSAATYIDSPAFALLRPALGTALPALVAPGLTRVTGADAAGLVDALNAFAATLAGAASAAAVYPDGVVFPPTAGPHWPAQREAIAGLAGALAAWLEHSDTRSLGLSILAI